MSQVVEIVNQVAQTWESITYGITGGEGSGTFDKYNARDFEIQKLQLETADGSTAVSYTHLTLPTNREV